MGKIPIFPSREQRYDFNYCRKSSHFVLVHDERCVRIIITTTTTTTTKIHTSSVCELQLESFVLLCGLNIYVISYYLPDKGDQ